MVVQVEFQRLICSANCVNGGAPPLKSLVRTLHAQMKNTQAVTQYEIYNIYSTRSP